ncbi:MAG: HEAT repeat domain-containing protein [Armatimonadota bacterium]
MLERVLLQGQVRLENGPYLMERQMLWQALLDERDHLLHQAREMAAHSLNPQLRLSEWLIAAGGSNEAVADWCDQVALGRWEPADQLWCLYRAIRGDRYLWKFLWDALPAIVGRLQDVESLVTVALSLGETGSDRAWHTLEPLLCHSAPAVRSAAATAVGALQETRAREPLRRMVQREVEQAVRAEAVRALGAVGNRDDAALIVDVAFRHPVYRDAARDALVTLRLEALPELEVALENEIDDSLREWAVSVLEQIGTVDCVPLLRRAVERDEKSKVRLAAIQALRRLGFAEGIPALIHALGDPSEHIRTVCVEALVELGEAAVEPLVEALCDPFWDYARRFLAQWAAARALGRIGGEKVTSALQQALLSDSIYNPTNRWAVLTALRYTNAPDLASLFADQLGNAPWAIQHEAALYLREYPRVESLHALIEGLKEQELMVPMLCRQAIAKLGVDAIPQLKQALEEEKNFNLRLNIARVLGDIGHPAGLSILRELESDPDERVRAAAADSIQRIERGLGRSS